VSDRTYLDHASTASLRPAAFEAMLPYLRDHVGDPGRLHAEGRTTRVAIENAREQVAALFGARPREIVFTSGGTESINAAIFGALADPEQAIAVTSAVEHSAVQDALNRSGAWVRVAGVDRLGRVDLDSLTHALDSDVRLVSVQFANHEVGTLQPVAEIRERAGDSILHIDACMANGHVAVDFATLGADLVSVSAHKFGGPKGAGALITRRGLRLPPFVVGGEQERARRGGLENVAAIVGFGAAAADVQVDAESQRSREQTRRLASGALRDADGVERYGDPDDRAPHIVCLGVDGVEAEPILLALDQRGIGIHSGSACSSEALEPSPVLEAMGVEADHSLRISVGWDTIDADVDRFLEVFPAVVRDLRALRT
jgi:cysteine desulfurase